VDVQLAVVTADAGGVVVVVAVVELALAAVAVAAAVVDGTRLPCAARMPADSASRVKPLTDTPSKRRSTRIG